MHKMNKYKLATLASCLLILVNARSQQHSTGSIIIEGGIVRGISGDRQIALVFTGDEWFEGYETILQHLDQKKVKGGFFLTGRLMRNPTAVTHIRESVRMGHYVGPHSDMHLLYNDWVVRDSLLVTRDSLLADLRQNLQVMQTLGVHHRHKLFIPPYEWWNREVSGWCRQLGWQVISFTPGTYTNADYTTPDMGEKYRSSDTLLQRLFRKDAAEGLDGAILLIHIGTDPARTDKLYVRLPELIDEFRSRGYRFVRIDRLITKAKPR